MRLSLSKKEFKVRNHVVKYYLDELVRKQIDGFIKRRVCGTFPKYCFMAVNFTSLRMCCSFDRALWGSSSYTGKPWYKDHLWEWVNLVFCSQAHFMGNSKLLPLPGYKKLQHILCNTEIQSARELLLKDQNINPPAKYSMPTNV